jgi:hypothetical protein
MRRPLCEFLLDDARAYASTVDIDGTRNFDLPAFHRKFAELIIEECIGAAVHKDDGSVYTADVAGYVAAGRSAAARMIREHFKES